MKKISAFIISLIIPFGITTEAVAQVKNDLSDATVYIAPKLIYSHSKISGAASENDSAFGGAVAAGYKSLMKNRMLPFRMEVEYAKRSKGDFKSNSDTFKTGADTVMFNFALGLNTGTKIIPSVTGGVGLAFLESKARTTAGRNSNDNTNFAWSLGGELTYVASRTWDVALEYRYIDFGDVSVDVSGQSFKNELKAHEIMLALRYKF